MLIIVSSAFFGFFQANNARTAEVRAAQTETALWAIELDCLEAQFQRHFMFNALTAVLACRHNPDAVAHITTGLSKYLRFCLSCQANFEPRSGHPEIEIQGQA